MATRKAQEMAWLANVSAFSAIQRIEDYNKAMQVEEDEFVRQLRKEKPPATAGGQAMKNDHFYAMEAENMPKEEA